MSSGAACSRDALRMPSRASHERNIEKPPAWVVFIFLPFYGIIILKGYVMKTLLGSGAHTNVYLNQDPEYGEVVIKEPKGNPQSGDVLFYVKRQMRGHDVVKRLRDSGADIGVDLPQVVRAIDTPEYHAVIEKRLPGKELTAEVYDKLGDDEREAVADKLARFLNVMHQMQPPQPAKESIKHRFSQYGSNPSTLQEFQDVLDNKIPDKYVKKIAWAESLLDNGNTSDEVQVMNHKDVRGPNLMYDAATGNLAVIDFEMAGVGNIYSDLIAYVPCNGLPWDLMKRVVKHYNAIENKKYPITLDINKVRAAMIYDRMHEIARSIKRQKQNNPEFKVPDEVIADIDKLLGELSSDKDTFSRGMERVRDKSNSAEMYAALIKNRQEEKI